MNFIDEKLGPIRKGLLELVVLKVIAGKKVYVADILVQLSATEFVTQEGTLYPLLSRMRREGFLDYEWVESESGPPRKYYQLTVEGKERLKALLKYWKNLNTTINNI